VSLLTGTQDPLFISSFQKGEEAAFDCLFREYFTPLTYFANRFVSDAILSEDIVQDCFVSLWQRKDRLKHVSLIKSYLYTTVRNKCFKQLEKQKRQPEPDNTITKTPSVEESIIAAETARELYRLIESLSPSLQKIIKLYYLEGKSNREIAVELDIEPDTVIRQRLRAIIALRKFKISPALYLLFYTREIQHIITCDSL
jgi:RNA polymerase sigma-70 factor (ECF subfamily)